MKKSLAAVSATVLVVGSIALAGPAYADANCAPSAYFEQTGGVLTLSVWAGSGNCSDPSTNVSVPWVVEDAAGGVALIGTFNAYESGQSNGGNGTVDTFSVPVPETQATYGFAWTGTSVPFQVSDSINYNGFTVGGDGVARLVSPGPGLPEPVGATPPPPPAPVTYSTSGTLVLSSHAGTNSDLTGTLTTSADGVQARRSGILMDLQAHVDGQWRDVEGAITGSTGTVKFMDLRSNHSQQYRMVPQNSFDNEGFYTTNVVKVPQVHRAGLHIIEDSTFRKGRTVTFAANVYYAFIWLGGIHAGSAYLDRPTVHMILQRLSRRTWKNVSTAVTKPKTADSVDLFDTAKSTSKTRWRWLYPGSGTFTRTTSASFTM